MLDLHKEQDQLIIIVFSSRGRLVIRIQVLILRLMCNYVIMTGMHQIQTGGLLLCAMARGKKTLSPIEKRYQIKNASTDQVLTSTDPTNIHLHFIRRFLKNVSGHHQNWPSPPPHERHSNQRLTGFENQGPEKNMLPPSNSRNHCQVLHPEDRRGPYHN